MKPIASCLADDRHVSHWHGTLVEITVFFYRNHWNIHTFYRSLKSHLKRALLEIIAAGVATTRSELEAFVKCTLFHSEHQFEIKYFDQILEEFKTQPKQTKRKVPSIDDTFKDDCDDPDFVGNCMRFLARYEFIRLQFDDETQQLKFTPTLLGYACLASSMPPTDGFLLFSELQKSRQNFVLETDLHAIYLVTPFSVCYQLHEINWQHYWNLWEKLPESEQRVVNSNKLIFYKF